MTKNDRWKLYVVDEGIHKRRVIGPYSTKCMRVLFEERKRRSIPLELSVTMSGWASYYRPSDLYLRGREFRKEPTVPDGEIRNESEELNKRLSVVRDRLGENRCKKLEKEERMLKRQIKEIKQKLAAAAKAEKRSKKGQNPEDSDTTSLLSTSGSESPDGGDVKQKEAEDKDLERKNSDEDISNIFL